MHRLVNAMKMRAGMMDAQVGNARFGTVSSYDAGSGAAKVLLQPENNLTGWLPVVSSFVGSGWGIHAALEPGTQVFIVMQEGDAENGVIVGAVYSNAARPPSAAAGELVLRHQSGSFLHLGNDGTVMMQDASGSAINMTNNGTIAVNAVLAVTGSIKVNGITVSVP